MQILSSPVGIVEDSSLLGYHTLPLGKQFLAFWKGPVVFIYVVKQWDCLTLKVKTMFSSLLHVASHPWRLEYLAIKGLTYGTVFPVTVYFGFNYQPE